MLCAEGLELVLEHLAERLGQDGASLVCDTANQRLEHDNRIQVNVAVAVTAHRAYVSLNCGELEVLDVTDRVLVCKRDDESGHGVCGWCVCLYCTNYSTASHFQIFHFQRPSCPCIKKEQKNLGFRLF